MASIPEKASLLDASFRTQLVANLVKDGTKTMRLGVWEAWSPAKPRTSFTGLGMDIRAYFSELGASVGYVQRFLADIFHLGPNLMLAVMVIGIWESMLSGWTVYYSNKLLGTIENGVSSGQIDTDSVRFLLMIDVGIELLSLCLSWAGESYRIAIRNRAIMHFDQLRISGSLNQTLQEFEDRKSHMKNVGHLDGGDIFINLVKHLSTLVSLFSETFALYQICMNDTVGAAFACIWILHLLPVIPDFRYAFWYNGCVCYAVDKSYVRHASLMRTALATSYRQEVLSGDLGSYLVQECAKCHKALGKTLVVTFYRLLDAAPDRLQELVKTLLQEFPTMYYAAHVVSFGSVPFRFSTMTSLQRCSSWLKWRIDQLFGSGEESLRGAFVKVKELYSVLDIVNVPVDDGLPYPVDSNSPPGMDIELRNVTFAYRNSKSSQPAVRGISCTLKAGQLVVIVGANGSAKTTLTKLLARLHEPSSGTILIDGRPASEYRVGDLRRATALLAQDFNMFPLSLAENIALGRPHDTLGMSAVQDAARKGGAHTFISKLEAGYETVLNPVYTKWQRDIPVDHALMELYNQVEKQAEVSGGENQRLVAARTFMRIANDRIRLIIVDEPSSAMDPEGEYELFKHLREEQRGRTMIFITHRFGHLTKHADTILCLKEGQLVESGTHHELLAKQGEYHDLYNIQAQAFTS